MNNNIININNNINNNNIKNNSNDKRINDNQNQIYSSNKYINSNSNNFNDNQRINNNNNRINSKTSVNINTNKNNNIQQNNIDNNFMSKHNESNYKNQNQIIMGNNCNKQENNVRINENRNNLRNKHNANINIIDNNNQLKRRQNNGNQNKCSNDGNVPKNNNETQPKNNISQINNNMQNNNHQKIFNNNNNTNSFQMKNQQENYGLKTPGQEYNHSKKPSISYNNNPQIGLNTPGQNKIENLCINCKKVNIDNPNINICKLCFKSKIMDTLYLEYLAMEQASETVKDFKGKIEIKTQIKEPEKSLTLTQAIEEYNKNYKNENLNQEQILNELKKRICRLCGGDINKENCIEIPCGCHFCSKWHLDEFLSQFNIQKDFKCTCNKKYTREMIFDLGVLSNANNIEEKKQFIYFFNKKLQNKCCICGKTANIINTYLIFKYSPNNRPNYKNHFLNRLYHYICKECKIYQKYYEFVCQICSIKHYLRK